MTINCSLILGSSVEIRAPIDKGEVAGSSPAREYLGGVAQGQVPAAQGRRLGRGSKNPLTTV